MYTISIVKDVINIVKDVKNIILKDFINLKYIKSFS